MLKKRTTPRKPLLCARHSSEALSLPILIWTPCNTCYSYQVEAQRSSVFGQGHTSSQQQSWNLNPSSLGPGSMLLTTIHSGLHRSDDTGLMQRLLARKTLDVDAHVETEQLWRSGVEDLNQCGCHLRHTNWWHWDDGGWYLIPQVWTSETTPFSTF